MSFTTRRVRTPTVLQMEAAECGAAALGILLEHYGRVVPLAELRRECGVSRDGSRASNVVRAARRYGLEAAGYRKELEELADLPAPYIVFWSFNHFLVVEGFSRDQVFLNDPATGPRTVSREEFDEGFTGVVLVCTPGPQFARGGQRPGMAGALLGRLSGFRRALALAWAAGLLLIVPGLVLPALTKAFVDHVIVDHLDGWLRPLLLALLAAAGLRALLGALRLSLLRRLSVALAQTMSGRFLWHALRLPVDFFAQRFAGEVAARARLNDRVADALTGPALQAAIDAPLVVLYGAALVAYDPLLAGVAGVGGLLNVVALLVAWRRQADAHLRLGQEAGKADGVAVAGLRSIESIKSSADEASFFARWAGYHAKSTRADQALSLGGQRLSLVPGALEGLSAAALLVIGGLRVIDGQLTLGDLVAIQALAACLAAPLGSLAQFGQLLQGLGASVLRLDDVLEHAPDPLATATSAPEAGGLERLRGRVELRGVTFGYSRLHPIVEDLDLCLEPGKRVAIVGGSGSGKSTISRLVAGLYEPWQGQVLLDGRPLAQVPRVVRATSVGMVEQDVALFAGTVRENLTLWDDTVPHADLVRACDDACITDVVRALPGGFEGRLLEGGANLSGGQRQRLELARALVTSPAVLVLDEATSALDSETERQVELNLRKRGCTCLVIAHRLSTIRDADEVVVLRDGRVVQRGTHAALWAEEEGEYAELIRREGEAVA